MNTATGSASATSRSVGLGREPRNLLVLGGSGFVGSSVCEKWVERCGAAGGTIVVPTRRVARAKHIQLLPTVQVLQANVHDDTDLARLVAGRDAVVNLIATLHGSAGEFQRVHVDLPRRLAQACVQAGVLRLVHVSALGADPNGPSHYLRSKAAGEAVLRDAGLQALTILRPSVIFGERDHFLNLFARLQSIFPVMPLGGAQARFQPVWVEDVAAAIVRCIADDSTAGQTFECTGPQVYTLADLVRLAGRLSGHERPVIALPDGLARLQATVMEWLPGEPLVSRDNLDSMRAANVAGGSLPGLQALGIQPAAVEAIASLYLGPYHGPARLDPWRARAGRL